MKGCGRQAVDAEDLRGVRGKLFGEVALGEKHRGLGVGEDESEALGRVGEVDGEVGAAGFEDGEEADDEVEGALHAKADDDFGADAEGAQMRGNMR